MKIYLDACCLNRATDDHTQERVRIEAEAVQNIISLVRRGVVEWMSSPVLVLEISRNLDDSRRRIALALLRFATGTVSPTSATRVRAAEIQRLGFGSFDALHLAVAEQGEVGVFLTTDDRLLRSARRCHSLLHLRVENPVSWYLEAQP